MDENIGYIKKLVKEKGYGFISRENIIKDLYFHASGLAKGTTFDSLKEGDNIIYDGIEPTPRGEQAYGVRLV